MTIWRDNHSRPVNVTIGTQELKTRVSAASDGAAVKPVGMALEPLTPDARNQMASHPMSVARWLET